MTSPLSGWTTFDTSTDTLQLRQQDLTDLLNTSPLLAGWTLVSGVARVTASSARIDAVFIRQQQYSRFRYRLRPGGSTASLELSAPPAAQPGAWQGSGEPGTTPRYQLTDVSQSANQLERVFQLSRA